MATKQYKCDFEALEQRRKRAAQLLAKGMRQADVARELGVSRQSVWSWAKAQQDDRRAWKRKPLGHRARLDDHQRRRLCTLLLRGVQASGFPTDAWTLRRIAQVIEREFGIAYGKTNVWLLMRAMGFTCQRPAGRARQRNEEAISAWRHERWPLLKKRIRQEKRILLFVDETGLSERPTRIRTWAPLRCTPLLQYSFNWKQLTVIAALGLRRFYFRFVHGPIRQTDLVQFLQALQRTIRDKLFIIWDGLPQHRSGYVAAYLQSTASDVVVEYLPGYAPELNPTEYI